MTDTQSTPREGEILDTEDNVTLVAIHTGGATTREAQEMVLAGMPSPGDAGWEEWWIADDQVGLEDTEMGSKVRVIDGSDNDPAVFVNVGEQGRASRILCALGLTHSGNVLGVPQTDEEQIDEFLMAVSMLLDTVSQIVATNPHVAIPALQKDEKPEE